MDFLWIEYNSVAAMGGEGAQRSVLFANEPKKWLRASRQKATSLCINV
jgi:hypothetical protein